MLKKYYGVLIGLPFLIFIWFLLFLFLNSRIVPSPFSIFKNLPIFFTNKNTYIHLIYSFSRILVGIVISVFLGTLLGTFMAFNKIFDKIFTPFVYLTYPIPKLSLLPIIVLIVGIGEASKIIMIVLIIVFQILTSIRGAILNIPSSSYDYLKVLGTSKLKIFHTIIVPTITKQIFVTLKIAIGTSISVLFFTENFGTTHGLGYYIMESFQLANYVNMYTGIILLSFMGFTLFILMDFLDSFFTPWSE